MKGILVYSIITLAIFFLAGNVALGQSNSVSEAWVARYNGSGNSIDQPSALAVDGSGNVYVTGYSYGSGTSDDYATIKYDASGAEQWVARYNGPGNDFDRASALAVDGSGNVYVTGWSLGSGTLTGGYATIKYDASGAEQWVAYYNGPGSGGDHYASALAVDGSGNVYVTGYSWGSGTGTHYDYATIKYDPSGQEQWVARYNGPGNNDDLASALAVDGSGNVYVTGQSTGSGTRNDYTTVKYDATGQEQWVARYNGPGSNDDQAYSLAVDGSGNVYVTGQSSGLGTSNDYATIKYDASGQEQWVVRYNGTGNYYDNASALAVDGSGNVYVTGNSWGDGNADYATIKYTQTSSPSPISVSVVLDPPSGEGSFDYTMEVTNLTDSSVVVDIWTEMFGPDDRRSKVENVVYDRTLDGNHTYSDTKSASLGEGGPTGDYMFHVNVGEYPDVITASAIAPFTKTTFGKGEVPLAEVIPTELELLQNYPNPFNPSTTIRYGLPERSNVKLEVFNMLGQRVALLADGAQEAGYHQVTVEGSSLASGVYVYRLRAGNFTETKQLMLIR